MKKLCPIHRYYYNGGTCPLCMSEKFAKSTDHTKKENVVIDEEITLDDISKLKAKFGSK